MLRALEIATGMTASTAAPYTYIFALLSRACLKNVPAHFYLSDAGQKNPSRTQRLGDTPISDAMTSNDTTNTAFNRLAQR